ncbi:MAG: methyltransferase domain-containing protein [Patescibacteria group bacterium]
MYIPTGSELLDPIKILNKLELREGMKIANLGCGTSGHFLFPSAKMVGDAGTVYAVDILKSALSSIESKAKMQNFSNVITVWSDIEVYGGAKIISDESCDAVYLINLHAKPEMLKEALRILKKNGKLLIVDWNATATPFGPATKDRVSAEEIKKRLAGFSVALDMEFEAGQYHWGLIYKKN